jgi:hypothetical protein
MNESTLSPLARKALARLARPSESSPPEKTDIPTIQPGAVVLVESKDQHVLAHVDLASLEEPGTNLKPGLWLCLLPADGEWFWAHASRVIDQDPACPNCGQRGRWQRVGTAFVCTACKGKAGTA